VLLMNSIEMTEYVKRIVDMAPPLTAEQLARLGRILRAPKKLP
jgi:hypothetical protein